MQNNRKFKKNSCISLFIVVVLALSGLVDNNAHAGENAVADPKMAFLPFTDMTVFKHKVWNIGEDVPRFFSDRLISETITVIPFDSVLAAGGTGLVEMLDDLPRLAMLGKRLGAAYLVTGDIRTFKITKKTAVMPELGGYKQYNAQVEIEIKVFDCDLADFSYTTMLIQDLGRRGLKFNPPGRLSRDESDYLHLETDAFASEEFMRTVIGEAMLRAHNELQGRLEAFQSYGGDTDRAAAGDTAVSIATEARILQLDGGDAYINAGRDERLRPGDMFEVFTRGEPLFDPVTNAKLGYNEKRVGQVKVAKVKAAHFSRVKILDGEGSIKVMDIVRLR